MLEFFKSKKGRIKSFLLNPLLGFKLMWSTAKKLTLINLALFVFQSMLPLLSLLILKEFIDDIVAMESFSWLYFGKIISIFLVVQIATIITAQLSAFYTEIHQRRVSDAISTRVLNKSVELDLEYFENPSFYDDLYIAHQQSLYRPGMIVSSIQQFIQSSINILAFGGFLIFAHWSIPLVLIALSIPLAITKIIESYQEYKLTIECAPKERFANSLFDYLTHPDLVKEVKVFEFGIPFVNLYRKERSEIYEKSMQLGRKFIKYNLVIQVFEAIVIIFVYGLIIRSSVLVQSSIGALVVYLTSFQRLQISIASFYQAGIGIFQQELYIQLVSKYLALPKTIANNQKSKPLTEITTLKVQGLNFRYSDSKQKVISNLNLEFNKGKLVAIVGENGSGKSTLVKLLCRLYDVQEGAILINGDSIKDYDDGELRSRFSVLFQDFGRYNLTVEENIAMGKPQAIKSHLANALEGSGFSKYIKNFRFGINTPLGRSFKNGYQLSGGQWQKLAIARALYKQCDVLILDEPTSSLDAISEFEILQHIKSESANKIVILISHRLSNLMFADEIYYMHEGTIVDNGRFDELMSRKGIFYDVYHKQAF